MSYILDALRKSEQERMRGKMPDLNHFGEEDKRTGRSHRWMWMVGGGLLLVNVAAVSVWLTRGEGGATQPVASASADKSTTAAPAPATNPVGGPSTAAQATAAVTTPVSGVASSPQTGPQAATNGAVTVAGTTIAPATAAPVPATVITTAPPQGTVYYVAPAGTVPGQQIVVVPSGSLPAGVAPGSNVVVQMPASSQPVQAWPSGPNQVVAPPPPVPPPPDPVNLDQTLDAVGVDATPAVSYLPQLDELPPQLRQQIPDMSFSSHMYSSMQRFRSVVINGNRVREGEMVGNNIQVREITETGVILSIGDTQFQVDVLGKWAQ